MSFQDHVKASVEQNFLQHAKFYFEVYQTLLPSFKADYHGLVAEHEAGWYSRSVAESAGLRVCEYLDTHREAREAAHAALAQAARDDALPVMNADGRMGTRGEFAKEHAHEVAQEQAHRVQGAFIPALIQGIANEIWHDPEVALQKAGPFVTAGEMLSLHGEAKAAASEQRHRSAETFSGEARDSLARDMGKGELQKAMKEAGVAGPLESWPATARDLGKGRLDELDAKHPGAVDKIIESRTSEGRPAGAAPHLEEPRTETRDESREETSSQDTQRGNGPESWDVDRATTPGSPATTPAPNFTGSDGTSIYVPASLSLNPESTAASTLPHSSNYTDPDSSAGSTLLHSPNYTDPDSTAGPTFEHSPNFTDPDASNSVNQSLANAHVENTPSPAQGPHPSDHSSGSVDPSDVDGPGH